MRKKFSLYTFIATVLLIKFATISNCTMPKLDVTSTQLLINKVSTYIWAVVYINSVPRQSFTLYFPTCTKVQTNTSVSYTGAAINITNRGDSSITFTLTPSVSALSYTFTVSDIKNCYYSGGNTNFTVLNNINQILNTGSMVYYQQGTISSCSLAFNGSTGQTQSRLSTSFVIQNLVIGSTFAVKMEYPKYLSSSWSLTTFSIPTCQMLVNGISIESNINPVLSVDGQSLLCSFSNNLAINPDNNLTLVLLNITNPVTSSMYASNTDFILSTFDQFGFMYDVSAICALTPVPISQYDGNFTQSAMINTMMSPVQLLTNKTIPLRIARNDQLIIQYTLGSFINCASRIFVDKSSGPSPVTFVSQPTSLSQTLVYLSNGSTTLNNTLKIQFSNCFLVMPSSTLPMVFKFIFSAATATAGVYDNYMQINSILTPLFSPIASSQVSLSLSDEAIGQTSSYTISLTIQQELGQSPSIIIDFPPIISISSATSTLSSCTVAINNNGIGSKNCLYLVPNSIQVNISNTAVLAQGTNIQITIPNLMNPSDPSSTFTGFNIRTYYSSTQTDGLVQVGTNVITSFPYVARTVYPQIPSNNFTVYTPNTQFMIVYPVGVNLPAGSIVNFSFTSILQNLVYLSSNKTGINLNQNLSNNFILNLPAITSGTTIAFTFTCLTPSKTGIYDVVRLNTNFNNIPYETTINFVTFQVTQPFTNIFSITPAVSITGRTNTYTFSFTTNVPMPSTSILQITYPSGTIVSIGQSTCILGCVSPNLTDTSSGATNRFQIVLQSPSCTSPCSFSAQVTMIKNPRQVGPTDKFYFKSLTLNSTQSILYGQAQTIIHLPNTLIAQFDPSDDYYLSNVNPVQFSINVTNSLQLGDCVLVIFGADSYTLSGTPGCASANCSAQVINGSTYFNILLSSTQITSNTVDLQIYGLISASNSIYGQAPVPVNVSTYSSTNKIIDSGFMYYTLSCSQNNFIIRKHCKTCGVVSSQYICTSCYSNYFLYNNDICATSCSIISNFTSYSNSATCTLCEPPCFTCYDQVNCQSCIQSFYYLTTQGICVPSCNISRGYYISNNPTNSSWAECKPCTVLNCISCPGNVCNACDPRYVLVDGSCTGGCSNGTYNAGGSCRNCDASCLTCDGPLNTNCFACNANYYPQNGACTSNCPFGSAPINGTCGCSGNCSTCITLPTQCLTCINSSYFIYNNVCSTSCPAATYPLGQQCLNCSSGCMACSSTTCIQCANNYSIYQNGCYQNCKSVGPNYSSFKVNNISRCEQCPYGCSQCTVNYTCSSCLQNYTLNGTVCKRTCELTNTCNVTVTVEPTLPLPGLLAFGIFAIVVVCLKLFILKDIYLPYTLLCAASIVSFILLVSDLGSLDVKIKSGASARLLLSLASSTFYTAQGILAAAVLLNYLMNFVSIWIFCKYIKPMISSRQIDRITNYITFVFGVLTNYRFYLLAFSRLVKKPYVQVKGPQKLKNLHVILGVSYLVDFVALVGAFILVINTTKLSVLFMISLDLIIMIFISWIVYAWVLVRPKSDQYYSQTKKYTLQQNHITQQCSIHNNNQKQVSKINLQADLNDKIPVQKFTEQNVDDMPTQQQNFIKVVAKKLQNIQSASVSNPKTKRKQQRSQQINNVSSQKKFFNGTVHPIDKVQKIEGNKMSQRYKKETVGQKKSDRVKSTSFEPMTIIRHQRNSSGALKDISKQKKQQVEQFEDIQYNDIELNEATVAQKPVKYKSGGRGSTLKIQEYEKVMKKKNNYGSFQSQIADSNVDEVDLQSIIQTKVIDRSKNKQPRDTKTEADKSQQNQYAEQISPSWFNIQNQRYDIDDKQLE